MEPREVVGAEMALPPGAMLLAAEVFDAAHMQSCGFLTRTVADGDTANAAGAMAQRIAALAPQAARLNKQTLRAFSVQYGPQTQVDCAQVAINTIANAESPVDCAAAQSPLPADPYAYADSAEHREGIAAFLEKRTPRF